MTSNRTLKNECKTVLDSIRTMLSPEDLHKVEPKLRQVLTLTKDLVNNAKVSPEDHEAAVNELQKLKKDLTLQAAETKRLRTLAETASQAKEDVRALRQDLDEVVESSTNTVVMFSYMAMCSLAIHARAVGNDAVWRRLDGVYNKDDNAHAHLSLGVLRLALRLLTSISSGFTISVNDIDDLLEIQPDSGAHPTG